MGKGCDAILAQVDAFLDGERGALERLRFAGHLALCPPCDTYVRQLQEAHRLLRMAATPSEADQDVARRLGAMGTSANKAPR